MDFHEISLELECCKFCSERENSHFTINARWYIGVEEHTCNHCKLLDMQNLWWKNPQTRKHLKEAIGQFHCYFLLPWTDKHGYFHHPPQVKAPLHWLIHMLHHLSHLPHSLSYMIFLSLQHLELVFENSICTFSEDMLKNCIQQDKYVEKRLLSMWCNSGILSN